MSIWFAWCDPKCKNNSYYCPKPIILAWSVYLSVHSTANKVGIGMTPDSVKQRSSWTIAFHLFWEWPSSDHCKRENVHVYSNLSASSFLHHPHPHSFSQCNSWLLLEKVASKGMEIITHCMNSCQALWQKLSSEAVHASWMSTWLFLSCLLVCYSK